MPAALTVGVRSRRVPSGAAKDRAAVRAFHAAALAAGAKDNGGPGIREHYHPTYYAAFVIDDSGHNIEVVVHRPE